MLAILQHTLRRSRTAILAWGLILAIYAGSMVGFYDNLLGMSDMFTELISHYPEELVAFVGGAEGITKPEGYLDTYLFSYLAPILGIYAIIAGSGLLVGDEERGLLDLFISHPISRTRLFLGRWLGFCLSLLLIVVLMWIGIVIPVGGTQLGLGALELVGPFLSLYAFLLLFGTLAFALSLALPSRNLGAAVAGLILGGGFMLDVVSVINPDLEPINKFSPYPYFQGGQAAAGIEWGWLAGLFGTALVFSLIAWVLFQRRDIRVVGEHGWGLPRFFKRRNLNRKSLGAV
jgi:ABC-2 type transport system permease protein